MFASAAPKPAATPQTTPSGSRPAGVAPLSLLAMKLPAKNPFDDTFYQEFAQSNTPASARTPAPSQPQAANPFLTPASAPVTPAAAPVRQPTSPPAAAAAPAAAAPPTDRMCVSAIESGARQKAPTPAPAVGTSFFDSEPQQPAPVKLPEVPASQPALKKPPAPAPASKQLPSPPRKASPAATPTATATTSPGKSSTPSKTEDLFAAAFAEAAQTPSALPPMKPQEPASAATTPSAASTDFFGTAPKPAASAPVSFDDLFAASPAPAQPASSSSSSLSSPAEPQQPTASRSTLAPPPPTSGHRRPPPVPGAAKVLPTPPPASPTPAATSTPAATPTPPLVPVKALPAQPATATGSTTGSTTGSMEQLLAEAFRASQPFVSQEAFNEWHRLFLQHVAKGERIPSNVVKDLWMKRRMNPDLKRIYVLAKRSPDEHIPGLDETEFIVGMQLIALRNAGEEFPPAVTPQQFESVDRMIEATPGGSASLTPRATAAASTAPTAAATPASAAATATSSMSTSAGAAVPNLFDDSLSDLSSSSLSSSQSMKPLPSMPPMKPTPAAPEPEAAPEAAPELPPSLVPPPRPPKGDTPPPRPPKLSLSPTLGEPETLQPTQQQPQQQTPQQPVVTVTVKVPSSADAPPLPPRARAASDLGEWLAQYRIPEDAQARLLEHGVQLAELWALDEETLVGYGILNTRHRLAIYDAVWLSRPQLPSPPASYVAAREARKAHKAPVRSTNNQQQGTSTGTTSTVRGRQRRPSMSSASPAVKFSTNPDDYLVDSDDDGSDDDDDSSSSEDEEEARRQREIETRKRAMSEAALGPRLLSRAGLDAAPRVVKPPPPLLFHKAAPKTPEELAEESAVAAQSLLRCRVARRFFVEAGEEKRAATEQLVHCVAGYVRQMETLRGVLGTCREVTAPSEGLKLFDELVDTLYVSSDLCARLEKRLQLWTRVSVITAAFNKLARKWLTKFCTWFMVRGLQAHAVTQLCSKRGKFRSALRACEEQASRELGEPVSVLTFIARPSLHVRDLMAAVTRLRDATPAMHPEMVALSQMLNHLVSAQESDAHMTERENTAKRSMAVLQERAAHMSGLPKHFIRYGRCFVTEGDLLRVKPEKKKPVECHYVLLSDLLLVGKQKGKRFTTSAVAEFDIASIRDIPDGTPYADMTLTNAFAINIAADTIVLACATSDQKKTTRTLFEKTLEAYKQDVARRRDEKATLIVSGL